MTDYIMNRESLRKHCEATCERFKNIPTSGAYSEHKFILDLLNQTEWIPITERLPNKSGRYLVSYNSGYVAMALYYESVSKWGATTTERIVAWMPLPESYKSESEVE